MFDRLHALGTGDLVAADGDGVLHVLRFRLSEVQRERAIHFRPRIIGEPGPAGRVVADSFIAELAALDAFPQEPGPFGDPA